MISQNTRAFRRVQECDKSVEELLDGNKRKIENLKVNGKMDLREGKNRLLLAMEGFSIIEQAAMKKNSVRFLTESSNCPENISDGAKLHVQQEGMWLQSTFCM